MDTARCLNLFRVVPVICVHNWGKDFIDKEKIRFQIYEKLIKFKYIILITLSFIMEDPNKSSRHRYFKQNLLDMVYRHISRVNIVSLGAWW